MCSSNVSCHHRVWYCVSLRRTWEEICLGNMELAGRTHWCPAESGKCTHKPPRGHNACHREVCNTPVWPHKQMQGRQQGNSLQRRALFRTSRQPTLLWSSMWRDLPFRVVMSGPRHCYQSPCSLHQQTGAGIGVMMGPIHHHGPHSLRHTRPAMSWCLADARKAAETAASARRLHCNALVCVSAKANASRLGQITC